MLRGKSDHIRKTCEIKAQLASDADIPFCAILEIQCKYDWAEDEGEERETSNLVRI
jgi:hypothetical protein